MSKNKNIKRLVNEILYPDIEDTIPHDIRYRATGRYELKISRLTHHVKKLIAKRLYTPYIRIKDNNGDLIFNDRLHISVPSYIDSFADPSVNYHVDFIDNGIRCPNMYCITTTFTQQGRDTLFGSVNFKKPLSELDIADYSGALQSLFENEGKMQENTSIRVNILTHHYNSNTKTWNIEFPLFPDKH
ncbi:hypothetical protein [Aquimarina sediminis]|uniref:hypothetical protein n=1 Tax=Aquimarina sediminis TaxID=2070536 RepID=UPI000CA06809|nr:hypothetical protein [Aquimarina sediminis]